ncbi:hypothetical protein [Alicyclobacillus herbarius]|uniref:hypothetical protein n=1 Tax=Alicyclobacillus herbarius TaxID=122960 RepID=UPI00047D7419|nr:hypothetical protein [Alicyclobacillus herbarius]
MDTFASRCCGVTPTGTADICGRRVYDGRLKNWARLEHEKHRLQATVVRLEEYLRMLDRYAVYRSPVLDGMPRGSGVSDSVSTTVVKQLERRERDTQLEETRLRLAEVDMALSDIESRVAELSEKHQEILRLIYRDRVSWESVCSIVKLEKSQVYRVRDTAIELLECGWWRG